MSEKKYLIKQQASSQITRWTQTSSIEPSQDRANWMKYDFHETCFICRQESSRPHPIGEPSIKLLCKHIAVTQLIFSFYAVVQPTTESLKLSRPSRQCCVLHAKYKKMLWNMRKPQETQSSDDRISILVLLISNNVVLLLVKTRHFSWELRKKISWKESSWFWRLINLHLKIRNAFNIFQYIYVCSYFSESHYQWQAKKIASHQSTALREPRRQKFNRISGFHLDKDCWISSLSKSLSFAQQQRPQTTSDVHFIEEVNNNNRAAKLTNNRSIIVIKMQKGWNYKLNCALFGLSHASLSLFDRKTPSPHLGRRSTAPTANVKMLKTSCKL